MLGIAKYSLAIATITILYIMTHAVCAWLLWRMPRLHIAWGSNHPPLNLVEYCGRNKIIAVNVNASA